MRSVLQFASLIGTSKMKRFFLLLIGTGFLASSLALANDEFRMWGDAKGKNKIKAKFVKLEDNVVTLENEDGDEIEVELKKLSPADQKFAAEAAKEGGDNPFKPKSDDPFKPKPKTDKPSAASKDNPSGVKETQAGSEKFRELSVDCSSAEQLLLGASSDTWQIEIPKADAPPAASKPRPTAIAPGTEMHETLVGMAINRGSTAKIAVVGFSIDKQGNNDAKSRVVLCDLSTGKSGTPAVGPGKMVPIALHDDGRQILMRRDEWGGGLHDRLEVWVPKGKNVARLFSWKPYDTDNGRGRDVVWAEFIDKDKLVTCSNGGKVVLWNFPDIEPVFQFDISDRTVPALSHNRKWLAYFAGNDIGVFDLEKREVIAQRGAPAKMHASHMAFSPSSARLACLTQDGLNVWNVETGKVDFDIPLTFHQTGWLIDYPDDNYVLVGNHLLIDIENQLNLWSYDGASQVRSAGGLTYFAVVDGFKKPGAIVPTVLPHAGAKDVVKKALNDPEFCVLRPGTKVRIDVSGIQDAAQRDRVSQGLKLNLEGIDCQGGAQGAIDLVASVEGPKAIKVSYIGVGEFNFNQSTVKVRFVYQNRTVWESMASNTPGFVHLPPGENMEGYLRKSETPYYDFFKTVQLPKYLVKPNAARNQATGQPLQPGGSVSLGTSRITAAGLR